MTVEGDVSYNTEIVEVLSVSILHKIVKYMHLPLLRYVPNFNLFDTIDQLRIRITECDLRRLPKFVIKEELWILM